MEENIQLKETIGRQQERIVMLESNLKNVNELPKEKLITLTNRIKQLEDQLQKSKTATCTDKTKSNTTEILVMKEEIENNTTEIMNLKKTSEEKIQNVTHNSDSFIKQQIDTVKDLVTDQLKQQSNMIDKTTTEKLNDAVNEHINSATKIIEGKAEEVVSKVSTPARTVWAIDTDTDSDVESESITRNKPTPKTQYKTQKSFTRREQKTHIEDDTQHLIIGDSLIQGIDQNKIHKKL